MAFPSDGVYDPRAEPPADADASALFMLSLDMLCIAGADGYFKKVNPAFQRILGYSIPELLARPFIEFVHPEDREKTEEELRRLVQGRPTIRLENRYCCKDGSYRWLAWTALPQDGAKRIYAVARDITKLKELDGALRESQERYRRLLEAVTSYRYLVEVRDGRAVATWHSEGCLATTGYAPEDYLSDPYLWIRMVHPDDRETVRQHAEEVLANQDVRPLEHRIVHRDGRTRWVRDTIVLHRDAAGGLVRYDGLVEDVTERKLVEERFRRVVESAPDATVVVDDQGKIVLVNAQTEKMFGYAREELLGQPVEVLAPERFRDKHVAQRGEYATNPRVRAMGTRTGLYGRRKDGSEFPAEIALSPIETDEGVLVYASIRDVTEWKRAEAIMRENEIQLVAAQRIQRHILPGQTPVLSGFEVAGASYPAEFTGGDTFDYLAMRDGSAGFAIGDVSGHGLGPALLMASTHAHLRSLAQTFTDAGEILALANASLVRETGDDQFVTLLLGRLDPRTRAFVYASAGHPAGYILDASGSVKACLESTSVPLGIWPDVDFPPGDPVMLEPGDLVLLITDGILEARSPTGDYFGTGRALEVVRAHRGQAAGEIIEALYWAVLEFSESRKPADDVTAVVIKVAP